MRIQRCIYFLSIMLLFALSDSCVRAQGSSSTLTSSATVTGSNSMSISVLNISDDQSAAKIQFLVPSGISKASQYVQIDFDSNALGARVVLRTDNKNNNPAYGGTGEGAGLIGVNNASETVPLLWAIFDDVAAAKSFGFTGDTDPDAVGKGSLPGAAARPAGEAEALVVDMNNKTPAGDTARGEIGGYEDSRVQSYATLVFPAGTSGTLGNFPVDEDGAGPSTGARQATSPVFVVLGAGFNGVSNQAYRTGTLGFDLVVQ